MARYRLITLGCKVNQYDGAALAALLRRAGLRAAGPGQPAELVVVNTCCVTRTAMRKSRQALRRALRQAPAARVLVTGCYADYDSRRLAGILAEAGAAGRAAIVGHHGEPAAQLLRLAHSIVGETSGSGAAPCRQVPPAQAGRNEGRMSSRLSTPAAACSPPTISSRRRAAIKKNLPPAQAGPIDAFAGRQRAFVKVQDGCDAFCSYCIVPFTRCRMHSRPAEVIEGECRGLLAAGHKEIVLCGVFLGAYGRATAIRRRWGRGPAPLAALLRRIGALDGLWRVRLSSLEPGDVTDELLAAAAALPTFAPHVHLPLQSGSARILRRMNRQYTPAAYRRAAEGIRRRFDRPTITTDVIVGFPGETEADFAETLAVLRDVGAAKVHAFPFSPIRPTAAWRHRAEAPAAPAVRERLARLAELERQLATQAARALVGETLEVLVERAGRDDVPSVRHGRCDRYVPVWFHSGEDLTGRVVPADITGLAGEPAWGLMGRRVGAGCAPATDRFGQALAAERPASAHGASATD